MKKIIFIAFALFCVAGTAAAQQKGSSKRTVEKNRNPNDKVGYNAFLLDAIKGSDEAFSELEAFVQQVWNEKPTDHNIPQKTAEIQEKIDAIRSDVDKTKVYIGGDEYQKAVLDYIDAVKAKVAALEKYGILGADPNSGGNDYNEASMIYNRSWDDADEKRDILKEKKAVYEKTFHMKK